jgi:hypothetical protein
MIMTHTANANRWAGGWWEKGCGGGGCDTRLVSDYSMVSV